MKNVLRKLSLPLLLLSLALATGCQLKEDPINTDPIPTPDYRDVFTGEYEFNWVYTTEHKGVITTQAESHVGMITKVGASLLYVEYRPSAKRRMTVTEGGELTDTGMESDGYTCSGRFLGSNEVEIEMQSTMGGSTSRLSIRGQRK